MSTLYCQLLKNQHHNAETVILLHGLFGLSDNLLGLAKTLQPSFNVLVPDLINHGQSAHREAMSYADMACDIDQLMQQQGIASAFILGHSMGGKVAMQMADSFAQRVLGLVIADIAPVKYPPHHNDVFSALLAVSRLKITQRRQADKVLQEYIDDDSLRPFFLKNMYKDDAGLWHWRFGLHNIHQAYPDICQAPSLTKQCQVPCLFIKGSQSDYISNDHQEIVKQHFRNPQLKIIDSAGHWLHAEKPKVFNRLVNDFFHSITLANNE